MCVVYSNCDNGHNSENAQILGAIFIVKTLFKIMFNF